MMHKINHWAVVVAAIAALVVGAVWYSPFLFGNAWVELRFDPSALDNYTHNLNALAHAGNMGDTKIPVGEMLAEFVRELVIAYVLARFVVLLRVVDWKGAVRLGIWVWIGFNAALLLGTVIHENMPWKLYAIHAGHGLVNILVMTVILGVWRLDNKLASVSP
jgi:hypothetical protein